MAFMSPENVNGISKSKAPPAACPSALENHASALPANGTEKLAPFHWAPDAGVKVTVAPDRSRGVELATKWTEKPDADVLETCRDPGAIIGARRGTVIVVDGDVSGNFRAGPPPETRRLASATVIVPATSPTWTLGRGQLVLFAGITTVAVVPPVANWSAAPVAVPDGK